jgi:class 3 adenylate cyclase
MKSADEITAEIQEILSTQWTRREGRQVPEPEAIQLGNDGVTLDGTVLYADMADSTDLVDRYEDWFAAEVYKSFLVAACHIIRNNDGSITAFDGDRVMAVFYGPRKNSSAAIAGLQINWAVGEINAQIESEHPDAKLHLSHSVGIDTSSLFVAKTGIRNSNDLVWVGRAANYAAKLSSSSEFDEGTIITEDVFKKLRLDAKNGGDPEMLMWEPARWKEMNLAVYKSTWTWRP